MTLCNAKKCDCAYVYDMYNNIYDYIKYGFNSLNFNKISIDTNKNNIELYDHRKYSGVISIVI